MSDLGGPPAVAQAVTRRSRRVSVIWIIPLVAVLIGAWLAWDTWSKQGPTITVTFDTAEGLQAGQSQLKFKDIVFGTVKSLDLTPDHNHVVVTIATTREAGPLLTSKTVFWVVKPRLFAGAISGLQTLFSGSYIGMLPGAQAGKPAHQFIGREDPPILETHVPGRIFYLRARRLGSISLGSPIFYRGLSVGEVLGWDIGDMAEYVTIHAFVRAPYDTYVHDDTRFWNASGLSVKLAGNGLEVEFESLRAVLLGGIAFASPASGSQDRLATASSQEDHVFPLFADLETAESASYTTKIQAVSYFSGSVSGLAAGSPVTIHGLVVGHVTDVRLVYDRSKDAVLAPVRYEVEPERVVGVGVRVFNNTSAAVAALLQKGLRATVESSNLITGQKQVALDFLPNAPPVRLAMEGDDYVLPTAPGGGFAGLQASANDLLDKVNAIPFDQIGNNLDSILKSFNDLASGPQMRQAMVKLAATIASVEQLTGNVNRSTAPALKRLPALTAQLQRTVTSANQLLVSLDNGYGNNTRFNRDMERLLAQTNNALASVRALADLLARHPEALIKGRPAGGVE
ncbi:MAG: intermembrane transport protein PqiB [Stellaceae bacterium]